MKLWIQTWNLSNLCFSISLHRLNKFLQYLTEAGFRVSRTHFDPTGVRTDATLEQFKSVLTKYSVPTYTNATATQTSVSMQKTVWEKPALTLRSAWEDPAALSCCPVPATRTKFWLHWSLKRSRNSLIKPKVKSVFIKTANQTDPAAQMSPVCPLSLYLFQMPPQRKLFSSWFIVSFSFFILLVL